MTFLDLEGHGKIRKMNRELGHAIETSWADMEKCTTLLSPSEPKSTEFHYETAKALVINSFSKILHCICVFTDVTSIAYHLIEICPADLVRSNKFDCKIQKEKWLPKLQYTSPVHLRNACVDRLEKEKYWTAASFWQYINAIVERWQLPDFMLRITNTHNRRIENQFQNRIIQYPCQLYEHQRLPTQH